MTYLITQFEGAEIELNAQIQKIALSSSARASSVEEPSGLATRTRQVIIRVLTFIPVAAWETTTLPSLLGPGDGCQFEVSV